jgi:hypothetical protein
MGHLARHVLRAAVIQAGAGRATHRAPPGQLCGTRIRHCPTPLDVRPLPIPMVLASFVTRLVTRVGPRLRLTSAPLTTWQAAVDLASIASPTDIEDRFTSGAYRLPKTLHPALPSEGRDEVGIACPLFDTPGEHHAPSTAGSGSHPGSAISFLPAAPGTLAYREPSPQDEFSASLASFARIRVAINRRRVCLLRIEPQPAPAQAYGTACCSSVGVGALPIFAASCAAPRASALTSASAGPSASRFAIDAENVCFPNRPGVS